MAVRSLDERITTGLQEPGRHDPAWRCVGGLALFARFQLFAADVWPLYRGPGEESNLACGRGEFPRSAPPCPGSYRMSTGP
jgi:hypothetical protein